MRGAEKTGRLSRIEFSRKLVVNCEVPGGVGGVGVGKFPRISTKILEVSRKFPRIFRDDRELQHGLV